MEGLAEVLGIFYIFILLFAGVWAILWFLVPFKIFEMAGHLKEIKAIQMAQTEILSALVVKTNGLDEEK